MPSLALTFDPRYVTAALDAWRGRDDVPTSVPDLERETASLLRQRFTERNEMGMRDESVAPAAISKALSVFTSLKLARKTTKRNGEMRIAMVIPTVDGREILSEAPIGEALYPRFAERLSSTPSDLHAVLELLVKHGAFSQPVLHLTPESPRRGAAYKILLEEGLREYRRQAIAPVTIPLASYEPTNAKSTPAQQIKVAQAWAAQAHPAGLIKQFDKAVAIGLAFGLLWADVVPVNEVIGAKIIGLAAAKTGSGYQPNILNWPNDSSRFTQALISAIAVRANGTGFATIQEIRGAIGRKLNLSPVAVDALLREARDAGDRHEIPIELHFEPDEDQLYASQRDPLVWHQEAFEFITVLRGSRS